ncbi:zeta toxin family protein [Streptomyces vinaceus]|uniref:zeta toxin family protein n=1 Tax=Streptomyces vinaceus TaxID=1960 RepID=UPI0038011C5E
MRPRARRSRPARRRGGAVLIGRDLHKKAHPHCVGLMRSDGRTAGVRICPDAVQWQAEVEEYARS